MSTARSSTVMTPTFSPCSTSGCTNDAKNRAKCGKCISEYNKLDRKPCATPRCNRLALVSGDHCTPCRNRQNRKQKLIDLGKDPYRWKECDCCKDDVPVLNFPVNAHMKDCSGKVCYTCQAKNKDIKMQAAQRNEPKELLGESRLSIDWLRQAIV